ncbi:MAG: tetratricopeptide repeat protein [Acidobacteriota bacterium]
MKKIGALLLLILPLLGATAYAQTTDLANSYYHFVMARMYDLQKEYSTAITHYEQAISLNPNSVPLRVEFARSLWQAGEIRRGVEECQKAIELDPNDSSPHLLLGQIYYQYQESMLDKAIAEFQRVLELEPDNFEALYYLGRAHFVKEDFEEAVKAFTHFVQIRPSISYGHYLKGLAHRELGEIDESIQSLEKAFELGEDNLDLLESLGELYLKNQDYDKALDIYRRAGERSSRPDIRLKLGMLLMENEQFKEAIPLLKEFLAQSPQNTLVKVELGKAYFADRQYSEAVELFSSVLESEPDNLEANFHMGRVLGQLGERLQAIERFQHLLKLPQADENRTLVRTLLGQLYQQSRQFGQAVETFRQLSEENPQDVEIQLRLLYALEDAGRLEAALSLSRDLLQKQPDDPLVVIARARMLSAAGELDEGMSLLTSRINAQPEAEQSRSEDFYRAAAQLYLEHKQYKQAEEIITQGLSQSPESETMQFQLAAIFERQQNFDRAEAEFKKILEANPHHAAVLNYLGYMLADQGIRLQEALGYIEKAVELDPHNGAYQDSLGWIYFKLNQLELAEKHLVKAARLNDSDATILEHLGDLYYRLNDYDQARAYYEQSLRFAEESEEDEEVREKLSNLKDLLSRKNR